MLICRICNNTKISYNITVIRCMMIKNLVKKLRAMDESSPLSTKILAAKNVTNALNIKSLKGLTKQALSLYIRENDIKNFTKLALSNPEDNSHDDIIAKLFDQKTITDALDESNIKLLSKNKNLFKDLGL